MLGERHKRMFLSDLRFFCSCCRTSCISVQPCTPKVLPNTETFLHSRVFFVTCVVPALCQIMYSLSVCSDGPPARTLSLTEFNFVTAWTISMKFWPTDSACSSLQNLPQIFYFVPSYVYLVMVFQSRTNRVNLHSILKDYQGNATHCGASLGLY